jgi:hypothetical protein
MHITRFAEYQCKSMSCTDAIDVHKDHEWRHAVTEASRMPAGKLSQVMRDGFRLTGRASRTLVDTTGRVSDAVPEFC